MVDMVVSRLELKDTIARLLKIMTRQPGNSDAPEHKRRKQPTRQPDRDRKAAAAIERLMQLHPKGFDLSLTAFAVFWKSLAIRI